MFDSYEHTLTRQGRFVAGYKHCDVTRDSMGTYLFTTLRLLRVLRGSADWKIGKRVFRLREGEIIAVNNAEVRQFVHVDTRQGFLCEIFAFLPTIFGSESECLRLFYDRGPEFVPVFESSLPGFENVDRILDLVREAFCSDENLYAYIVGLLSAAAAGLVRGIERLAPETLGAVGGLGGAEIISGAIRYINDNISNEFSVAELAAALNLSRGYFTSLFARCTGTTPAEFINRCRITNVITLLGTKKMNILDAAFASGFGSSSGFYRTFGAVLGMTPSEYLRRARRNGDAEN